MMALLGLRPKRSHRLPFPRLVPPTEAKFGVSRVTEPETRNSAEATVMAESGTAPENQGIEPPRRALGLRFLRHARGFWSGPERRVAWFWTGAVFGLLLANLAVNIGINRWSKWFFDALERRDHETLLYSAILIVALVVAGAAFAVGMVRCRMTLQVRWRQWLTGILLTRWLSEQRYYRLAVTDDQQINPEFRMADDVRLATEPVVEFATGFVNAVLSALAFVSILFVVGGSISLTLLGTTLWIPGYIALAAVLYAGTVSFLTFLIGRPLVDHVAAKNESEAQFRYD